MIGVILLVGHRDIKKVSGTSTGALAQEPKNAVDAVETDFHIAMGQTVLPANTRIMFVVHNDGQVPHELIIVKAPSSRVKPPAQAGCRRQRGDARADI